MEFPQDSFYELRKVVATAIENVPTMVSVMNNMRNTMPTEEQKRQLATEVVKIRKGISEEQQFHIEDEVIKDILTPLREEDKTQDLWTIFNICQEKMIKGSFHLMSKRNKMRKQRNISSIKKDMEYNQRLWNSAQCLMVA